MEQTRLAGVLQRGLAVPFGLPLASIIALGCSLIATSEVNRKPPIHSYWQWVLLWLFGLFLLGVTSLAPDLQIRRRAGGLAAALAEHRAEVAIVVGLTILAGVIRIVEVGSFPSPFSGDEAQHALQGMQVDKGSIDNPFSSGYQGQPTAYYFALGGLYKVFGVHIYSARLLGALLGTALIPLEYLFLRMAFDRRVALIGAVFLAGYHFALNYSRQDLNNIGDALVILVVAIFLYRAVTNHRAGDYVMAGLAAGLGFYVDAGARIAGLVLAAVLLFDLLFFWRRDVKRQLAGCVLALVGFTVAVGPIGYHFWKDPNSFNDRIHVVGIYQSGWMDREKQRTGDGELEILWRQAQLSFGAFGKYGDTSPHYHAPMPLIDHYSLAFFLVGAGLVLSRFWRRSNAILIATFMGVVITGGVLTIGPPTSQRLVGTIPVSAAFVGIGLVALASIPGRFVKQVEALPIALGVVVALAGFNLHYYFVTFKDGDYFSDNNTRIVAAAAKYVSEQPEDVQVYWFGAPQIYVGHPAFTYGLHGRVVYDVISPTEVVPPPKSTPGPRLLLVLPVRRKELDEWMSRCPGGTFQELRDLRGHVTFDTYKVQDCASLSLVKP